MELAGLEPATSWVRCIVSTKWWVTRGDGLPAVTGDSASGRTGGGTSRGYACTRLVPAAQGGLPPTLIRGRSSALRGYAIRRISFLIERVPPTCPASTPDPVTAWMAVAGSGVIPRKATLEAPVLPANRRKRRQPPGRTRDSMPLSEADTLSRQRASVVRGAPTRVMRYSNLVRAVRCVVD